MSASDPGHCEHALVHVHGTLPNLFAEIDGLAIDDAVKTTREKKVRSVGTITRCITVVLPQPPPPMMAMRGKPRSLGNLCKVSTVALARCFLCRCTR